MNVDRYFEVFCNTVYFMSDELLKTLSDRILSDEKIASRKYISLIITQRICEDEKCRSIIYNIFINDPDAKRILSHFHGMYYYLPDEKHELDEGAIFLVSDMINKSTDELIRESKNDENLKKFLDLWDSSKYLEDDEFSFEDDADEPLCVLLDHVCLGDRKTIYYVGV